jgi:hypothetical protein
MLLGQYQPWIVFFISLVLMTLVGMWNYKKNFPQRLNTLFAPALPKMEDQLAYLKSTNNDGADGGNTIGVILLVLAIAVFFMFFKDLIPRIVFGIFILSLTLKFNPWKYYFILALTIVIMWVGASIYYSTHQLKIGNYVPAWYLLWPLGLLISYATYKVSNKISAYQSRNTP